VVTEVEVEADPVAAEDEGEKPAWAKNDDEAKLWAEY